jgi:hypothetical protein
MLEPIEIEVEGEKFQLTPMNPFKARKADAKIMKVLAPLVGGLIAAAGDTKPDAKEGAEPNFDVSGEVLAGALVQALGELEETDSLFTELFATVLWLPSDTEAAKVAHLQLDSLRNIEKAFSFIGAGPQVFYKLAFEVARYNKFTPFVIATHVGGEGTKGTSGLQKLLGKKGLDLGRLVG